MYYSCMEHAKHAGVPVRMNIVTSLGGHQHDVGVCSRIHRISITLKVVCRVVHAEDFRTIYSIVYDVYGGSFGVVEWLLVTVVLVSKKTTK